MAGRLMRGKSLSRRTVRKVVITYAAVGFSWIMLTTVLLGNVSRFDKVQFETVKGLIYVTMTALILYVLLVRCTRALSDACDLAHDNEQRTREIYDHLTDGIVVYSVDADEKGVTYMEANQAFFEMTGYRRSELSGIDLAGVDDRLLERLLAKGHALEQHELPLRNGTLLPVEVHSRVFVRQDRKVILSVYRDIRERVQENQTMHQLAYRDNLTGLANSHYFYRSVHRQTERGEPFAIIMVVISRFVEIQEAFGMQKGSQLIRMTADRLRQTMAAEDVLARIDNTTFKLIVPGAGPDHTSLKIRSIEDLLHMPVPLGEDEISPDFLIGTASYPIDGQEEDALIHHAYQSLRLVQEQRYAGAPVPSNDRSKRRLLLESDLKKAIMLGQLALHFQPKIDTALKTIIGIEALVRWKHPRFGMVPPGEFIGIAEANGYIIPLGKWILHQACQRAKELQKRHGIYIPVAVNISLIQFVQGNIVQTVREALAASGLDAEYLTLEITESMTMNPVTAMEILTEIKALGVRTSLDDFGTGFSSLAYLKEFPIDELKIDKMFIDDLLTNENDRNIVRSIIAMAHSLKMKVVGEGVETQEQFACLAEMGCDVIQGYYLSPPIDFDALIGFTGGFAWKQDSSEHLDSFKQHNN